MPNERHIQTRSLTTSFIDTSSSAVTLEDIKTMIAESHESLSKDILDVKAILTSFATRVKKVEEAVEKIRTEQTSLKEEVQGIIEDNQCLQNEVAEFCMEELQNRTNRMNNLILMGVAEQENGTIDERKRHDEANFQDIIKEIGVAGATVTDCRRIGRKPKSGPRLLKVRVTNNQKKREILSKSKSLKHSVNFNNVFIKPDQTPMQQQLDVQLKAELSARRQNGENVTIYRGRVVPKNETQNFRHNFL